MSDSGSTRTLSSAGDDGEDTLPPTVPEVIIINTPAKFRDGKKWRQRFCVLSKLSPVADCLQLQVYRDEKEKVRNGHTKASLSLQHFLAMESGFTLDKESQTLAIICQDLSVVLAFDNRERLLQWSVRIANNLGEGSQFLAQLSSVPPKSKLTPGPIRLHVTEKKFCLTAGLPPRLLAHWEMAHLRRYGVVDGRLVFEGGSRSGKWEGLHVLLPEPQQTANIQDALDAAARGPLTRGPSKRFGQVTDSPRKSLLSKFGDMRLHMAPPSTACHNYVNSPVPFQESEEYHNHHPGSMSMDPFSSQNELQDGISGVHQHSHSPIGSQQPSQPQASAMERCLSCTSKLGQGGMAQATVGDLLKPSWTMDLSLNNEQSSCNNANADRISLSSHGSSGCEFYYDTPRGALLRRSGTPTGHFRNHPHAESPNRINGCRSPLHSHCGGHHFYNTVEPADPMRSNYKAHQCGSGPYENYDFPRPYGQGTCCQNGNNCSAQNFPGVDWTKKGAMDRHSVASTALCSDWYDTPSKGHQGTLNCSCAHAQPPPMSTTHAQARDPMENYDIPGNGQRIDTPPHSIQPVGTSVNGEGKMPLVTGSIPLKLPSQAIYAQVDKSKKTPKPPPLDPKASPQQPLYVNTKDPATPKDQSNYVNLEFVASLDLYENAKGIPPPPSTSMQVPPDVSVPRAKSIPEKSEEKLSEKRDLGLPLRRSSSVPCKGGHANRGSASSSDSGVSGDGGLFFEDGNSLNELGSLCLHESLPRKGTKTSPIATPKEIPNEEGKEVVEVTYSEIPEDPPESKLSTSPRHYETIAESEPPRGHGPSVSVAPGQKLQRLQSEAHSSRSTSSGTSDMSDYIETLSSSSRSSEGHALGHISSIHGKEMKTVLKPRSGKEYTKIDRSLFTQND